MKFEEYVKHDALGLAELWPYFIPLALAIPVLTIVSVALLKKQDK